MQKWLALIVCTLTSLAPSDEVAKPAATLVTPRTMDALDDSKVLRSGDLISFQILEDKEKKLRLWVQASGHVNCPHIGLLKAEGLTMKAFAFAAKKELEKKYYAKATVLVTPETPHLEGDPAPPSFIVFGMVARQGRYEIAKDEKLTLSGAILRAGGLLSPPPKQGKLVRKNADGVKTIMFDVKPLVEKTDSSKDLQVLIGDVIILPEPR